jgi:hypothetical protein
MPSPFPGMDPYLEGYLWPDVHSALANKLRQHLTPQLDSRYVARLEISVVDDDTPEDEIGIMYPDVEVMLRGQSHGLSVTNEMRSTSAYESIAAPLTLPLPAPIPVKLTNVEIRDAAQNQLVTCIEILSPVNKRQGGLAAYRQKRQRLYEAEVHLIEIDLLRRGTRPFVHPRIADAHYTILLTRARARTIDVWPLTFRQPLPIVPVPLRAPDADVRIDFGRAIAEMYDEARYDLSIDYAQAPPPPALSPDDEAWMRQLLAEVR